MNRRIFLHLSGPAALIGVLLFAAAIGSVWSIQRLQRNLTSILKENVTSLEASLELEISIRQLRYHSLLYLMDPQPERLTWIEKAHHGFEAALELAKQNATYPREEELIETIESKYARYREELRVGTKPGETTPAHYVAWANDHPVRHLLGPCNELLLLNKAGMEATALESDTVGRQTRQAVLALGVLGPIAGLIVGAIVARAWSRSIARLSVRLQDVHASLSQDVGEMTVDLSQDWAGLDRQLDGVVARVKEAAAQLQRQQQEILRAEQLAAVGQLAANVAHEIRNPLTSIKMLIGIALHRQSPKALTNQDLRVIYEEVGKLEHTVQGLLEYAKPPKLHLQDASLRGVVDQAVNLVRPKAEQNQIQLAVHAPAGDVPCRIDVRQMGNVVVNLLINAIDASPRGGTVEVLIERNEADDIVLSVADDGPGVAPEFAAKLFVPFASTKPTGTGLGLSISQRIVREHQGTIAYEARPEGGAKFTVRLNDEEVPGVALVGH
jgi:two-component system sensor histidine kinase HydH